MRDANTRDQLNDMLGWRFIISPVDESQPFTDSELANETDRIVDFLLEKFPSLMKAGTSKVFLNRNTRPSGYKAVHTNFTYERSEQLGGEVNLELQVVSEDAHRYNRLEASPVLYKAAKGFSVVSALLRKKNDAHKAWISRIGTGRGLTPEESDYTDEDKAAYSEIIELIRSVRERALKIGSRVSMPRSLSRAAEVDEFAKADVVYGQIREMDILKLTSDRRARLTEDPYEHLASKRTFESIVPPSLTTKEVFFETVRELSPELADNVLFQEAVSIAESAHARVPRKTNGEINYFEGHVLPFALSVIYKIATQVNDEELEMKLPVFCAALLHDFKEDASKNLETNPEELARLLERYDVLVSYPEMTYFDQDSNTAISLDSLVSILTKPTMEELVRKLNSGPMKISLDLRNLDSGLVKHMTTEMAQEKVLSSGNSVAIMLKAMDRLQNIRFDIWSLEQMIAKPPTTVEEFRKYRENLDFIQGFEEKCDMLFDALNQNGLFVKEYAWLKATLQANIQAYRTISLQRPEIDDESV